jgi:hypothetical protein
VVNLTEQPFFEVADAEALANKMKRLTTQFASQFSESAQLQAAIKANLASLGHALPVAAEPSHE